jgi:hypothetical protein
MSNKQVRESKQPRETISKKDFKCNCGKKIKKGDAIWYDPSNKIASCIECKPDK